MSRDNVAVDLIGAAGKGPGLYLIGLSAADAEQYGQPRLCAVVVEADGRREGLGEVPIQDAFDFTPATLIGPVPLGDEAEAAPSVDPFAVIEERLHARLSFVSTLALEDSPASGAYSAEAVRLAEALQRVRALQPPPKAEGLLDEDVMRRVGAHVWKTLEQAGQSTHVCDQALEAVRVALEAER